MLKKMLKSKKGGISVIIVSSVVLVVFITVFINMIESILHITTRNNVRNIIKNQADTININKCVTGSIYDFFNKDIKVYQPILKDYTITYIVFEVQNGNIVEVNRVHGNSSINLSLSHGQILDINLKQNTVSSLQKITNIMQGKQVESKIEISEKRVIND